MKYLFMLLVFMTALTACDPYQYDASSYIEMKKEPCFGFCPVYTFKVDGRGNATFSGENNVEKKGNWKRTLTPDEVNALFNAFEKSNFWNFKDEYTEDVTDLPTTWISFSHAGQTKKIKDYAGAPDELKNLEKLVEDIAETGDRWEQVE